VGAGVRGAAPALVWCGRHSCAGCRKRRCRHAGGPGRESADRAGASDPFAAARHVDRCSLGGIHRGCRTIPVASRLGIATRSRPPVQRDSRTRAADASGMRHADHSGRCRAGGHPAGGLGELGRRGIGGGAGARRGARAQVRPACCRHGPPQPRDLLVPSAGLVAAAGDCRAFRAGLRRSRDLSRPRPRALRVVPAAVRQTCQ
jgi:hypothetical protein